MRAVGALLTLLALVSAVPTQAADPVLMRLERTSGGDRNALLSAGVPLVAEMQDAFLALGDEASIRDAAARRRLKSAVLDRDAGAYRYAILSTVAVPPGRPPGLFEACGEVLWQGEGWAVLRSRSFDPPACTAAAPGLFLRVLSGRVLRASSEPPPEYSGLAAGVESPLEIDPLVVEMVGELTDEVALDRWQAVVGAATTRLSVTQGCQDAAEMVYGLFDERQLAPEYQLHTGGHAPNVIGTLPGTIEPSQVVIVIGHLDDMPSSGPAPGADDNGSGSAMVTSLAQIMSCYDFARTVRFLSVTGEEYGLYGSTYYAEQAVAAGEDIVAVLNGDMIGWQGNGSPDPENLDLSYNAASEWLGVLFAQAASDYGTGCVVDAFECGSLTASDHAPFWDAGFSAVLGITDSGGSCGHGGFNPNYHSSQDTLANCGPAAPAFLGSAVRAYLATAAHLADPVAARVAAPTGLAALPDGDHRIALSWDDGGPGVSYELYRAPGGCTDPGPPILLETLAATSWVDTNASGGTTYGYWLRQRELSGPCVSSTSLCVEAVTTGSCTEPPRFAGVQSVGSAGTATCAVDLTWGAGTSYCGGDVTYNVYRATDPGLIPGEGNRIASGVPGTGWTDSDQLVFPNVYYYLVRAEDGAHGLEDGNVVERSAAPNGPGGGSPVHYPSADTPIAIPDDDPTGIVSAIPVVDDSPIADILVNVEITHSWIGDLEVHLASPLGTSVTLHDHSGSSNHDIVTTYDTLTQPDGPGTLSDFDGEVPNGVWTLSVSDHYGQDVGTLQSWSLDLTALVSCETGSGSLLFADGFESGDTSRWTVSAF